MFSFPFHRVEKRKTGRKRSVKVVLRNETSDDFEPPPPLFGLSLLLITRFPEEANAEMEEEEEEEEG